MPIYEFYCRKCNTIYNFYSKTVNTAKVPLCPRCKRVKLSRRMSVFAAITGGGRQETDENPLSGVDERKMEKALMQLAAEAEKIKDDDPKAAAALMRKLTDATGMKMGDGMEEALQRLEDGDDPDQIDAEMGDMLSSEEPLAQKRRAGKRALSQPRHDETLYDL